jgi:hypothetical protein
MKIEQDFIPVIKHGITGSRQKDGTWKNADQALIKVIITGKDAQKVFDELEHIFKRNNWVRA